MPVWESSAGGGGGPNGVVAAPDRFDGTDDPNGLSAPLAGEVDLRDMAASSLTISQIIYQKNRKQENVKFARYWRGGPKREANSKVTKRLGLSRR
jgi:hypothetical protein